MQTTSVFLKSFSTRVQNVLIKHQIYTQNDLINFAKKNDLKQLNINCPNKISVKSIQLLEQHLPKGNTTLHQFYAQFPTRISNFLKRNNIKSKSELTIFLTNIDNQTINYCLGKITREYLVSYLNNDIK